MVSLRPHHPFCLRGPPRSQPFEKDRPVSLVDAVQERTVSQTLYSMEPAAGSGRDKL